jgi:hydroxylamine reductase (hybrid-cluster protein)
MLKMDVEDFIEEIKFEIISTEELGEGKAIEWELKFRELLKLNKVSIAKEVKGKSIVSIKDESTLFSYADNYWAAIDSGEEEQYWHRF